MTKILGGGLVALAAASATAQEGDAVVITATRAPRPSLEIPAASTPMKSATGGRR